METCETSHTTPAVDNPRIRFNASRFASTGSDSRLLVGRLLEVRQDTLVVGARAIQTRSLQGTHFFDRQFRDKHRSISKYNKGYEYRFPTGTWASLFLPPLLTHRVPGDISEVTNSIYRVFHIYTHIYRFDSHRGCDRIRQMGWTFQSRVSTLTSPPYRTEDWEPRCRLNSKRR